MYTASKMLKMLELLAVVSLCAHFTLYAGAMVCELVQEPDASSNKLRWVIPVREPCVCTQVRLGGVNTVAPYRPFSVIYHDAVMMSDDADEIKKWLNCKDIDECVLGSHSCDVLNHETCVNTPGGFDCVCKEGYQLDGGSCKACHFSTVPHPKPYSYMFILEPQMAPFTVNFSVETGVNAMVGLSENKTDESVVIEILFGYKPERKRIAVRACMPHLCSTKKGDGTLRAAYSDTSPLTDSNEYRHFWIHYNEGVVTAGKGDQQRALVEWNAGDHHGRVPTQLHIGISTWEKAIGCGEWDFCQ